MFRLGYNTNGLAHHRPADAVRLLSDLGYEGVAITPDVGRLDPFDLDPVTVDDVRKWGLELGLEFTVETGARYVLDARRKHAPTLLDDFDVERQRRVDFLRRCVDLAADLGATTVSFWSGRAPEGAEDEALWDRLLAGARSVLAHARERSVNLAFEPEPGMWIERPGGYAELVRRLGDDGDALGLCLDVGHCLCTGDLPVERVIAEFGPRLFTVHLDDIAGGVHEHRMFGEGELDLPAALGALLRAGFDGLAAVELSRDGHRGPEAAAEALRHLHSALQLSGKP
jgi:sugar phosphate isomerase/epimerase